MYLEELINSVHYDNSMLECNSRLNREDVVSWLKTIAGFANANGGDFYISVEDKTNRLIGFDRLSANDEREYFINQAKECLTPLPDMSVSFIRYDVEENEQFIIHIHVNEALIKPVILEYNNIPSIYKRRDGFTNGASYEEIIEMSIKSKNIQYDVLPSDEKYDVNNISKLREFYKAHNNGKELKEKSLYSLRFITKDGYLANGARLFLDNYCEKKTEVQCSMFPGFNRGSDKIITINRFNGNIIDTIEYIVEFVKQRMNHCIIKQNDGRVILNAFPERSLFEGVINAVAHRDYYLDGTQIQIDLFKDRLEISSPGGFYKGGKLGKIYDLSGVISKRRNELIAGVLVYCNVMEAAGTGFDKIAEDYSSADERHKPYIYSASDHFTLVLPDLTFDEGISESSLPKISFMPVKDGTTLDEKVLSFCYFRSRSVSEIASFLNISDSTYLRKKVLENLVDNGYLEKSKVSRATHYKTKADMVYIN